MCCLHIVMLVFYPKIQKRNICNSHQAFSTIKTCVKGIICQSNCLLWNFINLVISCQQEIKIHEIWRNFFLIWTSFWKLSSKMKWYHVKWCLVLLICQKFWQFQLQLMSFNYAKFLLQDSHCPSFNIIYSNYWYDSRIIRQILLLSFGSSIMMNVLIDQTFANYAQMHLSKCSKYLGKHIEVHDIFRAYFMYRRYLQQSRCIWSACWKITQHPLHLVGPTV